VDDWFHTPGWKRLPEPGAGPQPAGGAVWVVLGNELDLGRQLAQRLAAEGATVVPVAAGTDLSHHGDGSWSVDPADRDHLTRLIGALDVGAATAVRFVHLWSLSGAPAGELDEAALDRRAGARAARAALVGPRIRPDPARHHPRRPDPPARRRPVPHHRRPGRRRARPRRAHRAHGTGTRARPARPVAVAGRTGVGRLAGRPRRARPHRYPHPPAAAPAGPGRPGRGTARRRDRPRGNRPGGRRATPVRPARRGGPR